MASAAAAATAKPTVPVVMLPPATGPCGALAVSPSSTWTLSSGTPNASAASRASPVLEPLMSTVPICTVRLPSGSTRQSAAAAPKAPPQPPTATPTPSPSALGAV